MSIACFHHTMNLLAETGTDCLAWPLMSNDFHLLLYPWKTKLSVFMRRFLTGYCKEQPRC